MESVEERAREIVDEHWPWSLPFTGDPLIQSIAAALRREREEALREAARLCAVEAANAKTVFQHDEKDDCHISECRKGVNHDTRWVMENFHTWETADYLSKAILKLLDADGGREQGK